MESMRAEFARLAATLVERRDGQAVYYLPNSGNWGDALIRQGTRKLLQELGIA
jgi:hypothetical protein